MNAWQPLVDSAVRTTNSEPTSLAALEGALILARAQRSTKPLDTVERYFATRPPGQRI